MRRIYQFMIIVILLLSCEKAQDKDEVLLKYYGDAYEDIGYSVTKVDDGYIIAGQFTELTRGTGNYITGSTKKMVVIKAGLDGNRVWKQVVGDRQTSLGSKAIVMEDGSVICLGYAIDTITLQKNIYAVKLDAAGNVLLTREYKKSGNQYGTDIIKTPEGFLILGTTDVLREPVTEYTGNAAGKKDILLVRVYNNLEYIVPPRAEGFIGNDEGVAIKSDMNGGYIVVGTTDRSDLPEDQAQNNIFLMRINSDGSTTQPRIIGGTEDEYARDIEVLSDGYLVAGTIGNEGADQRGYVWKIPVNIYDGSIFGHDIVIDPSVISATPFSIKAICRYKYNSFLMAGQYGTGLSARMLIFVTDADGYMIGGKIKITGGTGTQAANDVISDNEGNIIAVGKNSFETNSMISLLKFRF